LSDHHNQIVCDHNDAFPEQRARPKDIESDTSSMLQFQTFVKYLSSLVLSDLVLCMLLALLALATA